MGSTKTSSRRRKTVKNRLRGGRKSRSNKKSLKRGGGPAWETVDLIRYKKVRDFTGQFRDGILTKSRYFIRYKDDKDDKIKYSTEIHSDMIPDQLAKYRKDYPKGDVELYYTSEVIKKYES